MAGENVKNFFEQPGKDGDNKFIMKGSSATGSGISLKTIMLHGRIPNATSTDGTSLKTDAIPIPFNGEIISIQAALRTFPPGSQIILESRTDSGAITGGEIVFDPSETFRTKEVFPTGNNTVVAGNNFFIVFSQSNTETKPITGLIQVGGIATATVQAHGYETGDIVSVEGADQSGYNGLHRITKESPDKFVFVVFPTIVTPATTSTNLNAVTTPIIPINYSVVIELD